MQDAKNGARDRIASEDSITCGKTTAVTIDWANQVITRKRWEVLHIERKIE